MEITEVLKQLEEVENRVKSIREMATDYNACKNTTSKTYLLAAINKLVQDIMPKPNAR